MEMVHECCLASGGLMAPDTRAIALHAQHGCTTSEELAIALDSLPVGQLVRNCCAALDAWAALVNGTLIGRALCLCNEAGDELGTVPGWPLVEGEVQQHCVAGPLQALMATQLIVS